MLMYKGLGGGEINLFYGKKEIKLPFSNLDIKEILLPSEPLPPKDIISKIRASLAFPIQSEPFRNLFSSKDRALILVSDITRKTRTDIFLPILIDKLNECGIADKNIEILFTTGIHRKLADEEQAAIIGKAVASRVKAYNHNSWSDEMVKVGTTSKGNEIFLNKRISKSDKIILTGAISFHYLAGFGGGRKSLLPGIASYKSIINYHLLSLFPEEGKGRHPNASTGILAGNPMHEEMDEVLDMVKPSFILNTAINSSNEILEVFAGNPKEAFMTGCIHLLDHCAVKIKEKSDLVIASCGGFPLDINFIQAHKTLGYTKNALKKGGVLILLAECSDGIGNESFLKWFNYKNPGDFESALRKNFEVSGQTAYSTFIKAKDYKIILVSSLPKETVEKMSMIPAKNMDEALDAAINVTGKNPFTYIIPQGAKVLPYIVEK